MGSRRSEPPNDTTPSASESRSQRWSDACRQPLEACTHIRQGSLRDPSAVDTSSTSAPPFEPIDTADLKGYTRSADIERVDAAERREILNRYRDHSRRFEAAAARRSSTRRGAVIPFTPPAAREVGQDPTAREIEVLQLVADGLVNREIGERLFLSEETVKSHVRHLLAKLQARSRAHAVAVGFRRGLIL